LVAQLTLLEGWMVNGFGIMVTGLSSMDTWTRRVDVGAAKLELSVIP